MSLAVFVSAFVVLIVLIAILMVGVILVLRRRQRLFHKHILVSRRYLALAVEAGHRGESDKLELYLAASQEELDRAEFYQ